MTIHTVTAQAFPTAARIGKLLSIARRFLAHQTPNAQLWQVLLGHMSSLEKLVPHGQCYVAMIQRSQPSDSPYSDCHEWPLEQWEVYRPSCRHSGNPTIPSANTPSSPASKPAASSPAPLPHSAPLPSEGLVLGEEMTGEYPKQTRVSSSPALPVGEQGKRVGGGGTDMELAADGSASPLPFPSEGERMEPSPPQPPRIVTKASISPRPNSHISHSYPPYFDSWSERGENRSYSHAPFPTLLTGVGYEREMPGDRLRAALDRQRYHGPHPIPAYRLRSHDNDRYSSAPQSRSPATCCSLARSARITGYPPTIPG